MTVKRIRSGGAQMAGVELLDRTRLGTRGELRHLLELRCEPVGHVDRAVEREVHAVGADADAVDAVGVLPARRDEAVEVDERVAARMGDEEVAVERVDTVDAPRVELGWPLTVRADYLGLVEERGREDHQLRPARRERFRSLVELGEEVAVEADLAGLVP